MKTRVFFYLFIVLTLVAMLTNVACRAREQPLATLPPQPPPIGGPSVTPVGGPPPQPKQVGAPSVTPRGGPTPQLKPVGVPSVTPMGGPPQPAAGQPDLVVGDATVTPTANPGEVRIHIVARNQGGGTITAAFTVRWHPHQKDKTQVGCSEDFYNLNQKEWVVDCTYTYPANQRGEMHWVAAVDAENDVKNESNENNNEKTGTITIGGGGQQPQPPAGQAPPAPTNCTARQVATAQVAIEWQFSGNADGFKVYQGTTSLEKTVASNLRSVTISGLAGNVQHHFDVRAYNAAGESKADACSVDVTPR